MDADSGEALWEPWIDGFERAMRLRRGAWTQIVQSGDREEEEAINMIVALSGSCYDRSDLTEETEEELRRPAPELIPEFVRNPNALTKSGRSGKATGARRASLPGSISTNRRPSGTRWGATRPAPADRTGNTRRAAVRTDRRIGDGGTDAARCCRASRQAGIRGSRCLEPGDVPSGNGGTVQHHGGK